MPRILTAGMVMCAALSAAWCVAAGDELKPNILVIVADDLGYADVGFQGCRDIPTPQLDALAQAGVHCPNGYVSHSFCSPSRAGLLTGRYQARFGYEFNPVFAPNDPQQGVPTDEHFLPEYLGAAGYATGWIGKWHLGATPAQHPEKRGFQETFGFIGGGHHYQNWEVKPSVEYLVPIERNGKPVPVKEHLTKAFGHEAVEFIRRHKEQPWFLYLAFNAPHTPHEPTAERLEKFAAIADKKRRSYAAQVSLLDDAVGETLAALKETKTQQRTLVFFFSDNGGPIGERGNGSQNTPLRAGKGTLYEGGVRVPFVVCWPGTLPAGKSYNLPVSSLDVFATALGCAGAAMPSDRPHDSVNLLPYLSGEETGPPHDQLFWRMAGNSQLAVRQGDLKLLRIAGQEEQVFQLGQDVGETKNLAPSGGDKATPLRESLDDWTRQLPPSKGAKAPPEKNPPPKSKN